MLEPGVSHEEVMIVTEAEAIHFMGGGIRALSTPSMIMWLEITARNTVLPLLAAGEDTVGTQVNVSHLAATPLGMKVTCRAKLTAVDRRRLLFSVEAFDEQEKISEGTHERFVVDVARYAGRLGAKLGA